MWRVCLDSQPNHQQPYLAHPIFSRSNVLRAGPNFMPLWARMMGLWFKKWGGWGEAHSFQQLHSFELISLTALAYDLTFIYSTTIYWDLTMSQGTRDTICSLTAFPSSCFYSPVAPDNLPRSVALKIFGLRTFYSLKNYQGSKDHYVGYTFWYLLYARKKKKM